MFDGGAIVEAIAVMSLLRQHRMRFFEEVARLSVPKLVAYALVAALGAVLSSQVFAWTSQGFAAGQSRAAVLAFAKHKGLRAALDDPQTSAGFSMRGRDGAYYQFGFCRERLHRFGATRKLAAEAASSIIQAELLSRGKPSLEEHPPGLGTWYGWDEPDATVLLQVSRRENDDRLPVELSLSFATLPPQCEGRPAK